MRRFEAGGTDTSAAHFLPSFLIFVSNAFALFAFAGLCLPLPRLGRLGMRALCQAEAKRWRVTNGHLAALRSSEECNGGGGGLTRSTVAPFQALWFGLLGWVLGGDGVEDADWVAARAEEQVRCATGRPASVIFWGARRS